MLTLKDMLAAAREAVEKIEAKLGDSGRVLLRYSGTEPLLRVMLEGEDQQQIEGYANELAGLIRRVAGYKEG